MKSYKDKHGKVILEGMLIKHDSGEVERVHEADSEELGINASNEAYLKRYGTQRELYLLQEFDLNEWEVIK